jgi:hypothetical protein
MRIVDLAASLVYALLCISLISLMNPYVTLEAQAQLGARSRSYSALSQYLSRDGLPFLSASTPGQICSSLEAASNGTLVLSGVIDGVACSPPRLEQPTSDLTLSLGNRTVVIEAWLVPA